MAQFPAVTALGKNSTEILPLTFRNVFLSVLFLWLRINFIILIKLLKLCLVVQCSIGLIIKDLNINHVTSLHRGKRNSLKQNTFVFWKAVRAPIKFHLFGHIFMVQWILEFKNFADILHCLCERFLWYSKVIYQFITVWCDRCQKLWILSTSDWCLWSL